jgi:hypothetical protein
MRAVLAERNAAEAERRMREHIQAIQDSLQLR